MAAMLLASLLALATSAGPINAATLTWNADGTHTTDFIDGAGTWETGVGNWYDGGTNYNVTWAVNSDAVFGTGISGGTAGVITINNSVSANSVTFNLAADNLSYSLSSGSLNLTGLATITTVGPTNSVSVSSVITGSAGLNKTGAGTLTLTGSNFYTGGTTVNGGELELQGIGNLGSTSGQLTVTSGTLDLNGTSLSVGNLTGAGTIVHNHGTGIVNFTIGTGDQGGGNYSGVIADNSGIGTGTIALIKIGTGTITLSGINTFSGGVALTAGNLTLGSTSALGASAGTLTISGGSLDSSVVNLVNARNNPMTVNSDFTFVGSQNLNLGTGAISLGTSAGTARMITVNANNLTLGGVISDGTATGLTKAGAGTLTLTGINTYTGDTTVSAGTLQLNTTGGTAMGGNLVVSGGTAQLLQSNQVPTGKGISVSSGLLDLTGKSNTVSSVQLTGGIISGGTLTSTSAFDVRTGSVSAILAGANGLTKSGAGTVTLSGANTYNGPTFIIDGGTLNANAINALPTANGRSAVSIDQSGSGTSMLALGTAQSIASLAGASTSKVNLNAYPLTIGTTTGSTTFAGVLSSSTTAGALIKDGASTQVLSGANTYTGSTTISNGILQANHATALGNGGNITFGGGTLQFGSALNNTTVAWGAQIKNSTTAAIKLDTNSQTVTLSGTIPSSNTQGLTKIGDGTMTVGSSQSYVGPTVINGGTLRLSSLMTGLKIWDFESGTLAGWNVVTAGDLYPSNEPVSSGRLTHQGTYWIDTYGALNGGNDAHTGTIQTDTFVLGPSASISFMSGGRGGGWSGTPDAPAAGLAGIALERLVAGVWQNTLWKYGGDSSMNTTTWDVSAYAGATVRLRIYDTATGGWGWVTADNIQCTAATVAANNLLPAATALSIASGSTFDLNGASQQVITLGDYTAGVSYGTVQNSNTGAVSTLTLAPISGSTTFTGVIAGGGVLGTVNLTMSGTGTQVLAGANTYTGTTTLSSGELELSGAGSTLGATSTTLTVNGGTLDLNNTNQSVGNLSGTGGRIGNDHSGAAGTVTLTIGSGNTGGGTFSGVIADNNDAGTGKIALTKIGTGTITLSGPNTYTGTSAINGGILQANHATALGNGGTITFGAGTLQFGSALNNTTVAWGARIQNNTAYPITLDSNGQSVNISGNIPSSNTAGLTKIGAGTVLLSGANAYIGTTTVSAGILTALNSASLPNYTTQAISVAANATLAVRAGAGSPTEWGGTEIANLVSNSNLTFANPSSLGIDTTTGNFNASGALPDKTNMNVQKLGANILTLSGANSYSGNTIITNGTLQVGAAGTIPNGAGKGNIVFDTAGNTAVLDINGIDTTINGLSQATATGTNKVVNNSTGTTKTLTVGNNDSSSTFAGVLANNTSTGGTLALTKTGAGTLTLANANANTYTGATNINGGTLKLLGSTPMAGASAITVNSGGTLLLDNNASAFGVNNPAINLNGGTLGYFSTANSYIVLNNNATSIVTNQSGTSSTITIQAGGIGNSGFFLDGGLKGTSGTVTVNNSTAGVGLNLRNTTSTFAGTLIVNGIASTSPLMASGIGVGGNTTGLQNADITLNGTMELQNQGIGWANTRSATQTFLMGALNGTGVMIGNSNTVNDTVAVTVGNTNNNGSFSGVIANGFNDTLNLVKTGTGTQVLSGPNTYTGTTTVNGGTLQAGSTTAFGPANIAALVFGASSTGKVQLYGNSMTVLSLNTNATVGTPILESGSTTAGTDTLTVNNVAANTFAGVLQDGSTRLLAITKGAVGTLTLSGLNTYTGGTNVGGGTLLAAAANNLPSAGNLTVNAGGTFSMVNSAAVTTYAANSLTLANGANLAFDLVGTNVVDVLTSTNAATTSGGNIGISIAGSGTPVVNAPTTLISSSNGGLTTGGANYFVANNTNYTATLNQSANAVQIASYTSGVTSLTNAYWLGNLVNGASGAMALSSGGTSNWASAAAGTSAGGVVPRGTAVNVIFGATGASQQANVTTGADMTLGSITFNDGNAVTLGGSNLISLNNTSATAAATAAALATITNAGSNTNSAISVTTYANANNTINANLVLSAGQTWNIATGKTLAVNGTVNGTNTLTIGTAGNTGTVILAGANTYTGATTINYGTVKAGGPSVAGVSGPLGNNSAVSIGNFAGTVLNRSRDGRGTRHHYQRRFKHE